MEVARQEVGARRLRFFTRLAAIPAAAVLGLSVLPWPWASMLLPAVSPYVAVGGAMAARAVGAAALAGLPVLLASLISPRWFCRYACPVGLIEESVGRLRRSAPPAHAKWPPVGQWIALVTLGGAIAGYPLLLWLDPLALLAGFFGAWRWPLDPAGVAAGLGLPLVLAFGALFPHAWCARVCPLGAMQDLVAWPRRFLGRARALSPPQEPARGIARRSFLGLGLGGALGLAVRATHGAASGPLRPPGAVEEPRFSGLCVRCGNCVRACPAGIIRPDLGRHGLAGFLSPVLCFDENYCLEDCLRCGSVCPSGAIGRLAADEKRTWVVGVARVDLATCLLANGRDCTACFRACPYEAVAAEDSADGMRSQPRVDLGRCTGCGACETACPTSPEKAIKVYPPGPCHPSLKSRESAAGPPATGPRA